MRQDAAAGNGRPLVELRHIRYFVAVAEELHFGRASELLSVTRPAVSQTVADLEAEIGVRLFNREAQKITLTEAGAAFHKLARTILQDVAVAVKTTRRIGEGKMGLLTIGYGSLGLRHPMFREAVKLVGSRFPGTDLSLQELQSSRQIEEIRAGKLDAGFVYVARETPERATALPDRASINDLQSFTIEAGGLGVAMPRDHPMAGQAALDLSDLSEEGFIVVGPSMVNPYFPFVPRIVQEVSNIATQTNLISVGMGVGLVVTSPQLSYPQDVKVVPLRNISYVSEFRLVWRGGAVEPILQNFIDIVRELSGSE